jgi:hypothetical protein
MFKVTVLKSGTPFGKPGDVIYLSDFNERARFEDRLGRVKLEFVTELPQPENKDETQIAAPSEERTADQATAETTETDTKPRRKARSSKK